MFIISSSILFYFIFIYLFFLRLKVHGCYIVLLESVIWEVKNLVWKSKAKFHCKCTVNSIVQWKFQTVWLVNIHAEPVFYGVEKMKKKISCHYSGLKTCLIKPKLPSECAFVAPYISSVTSSNYNKWLQWSQQT